MLRTLPVSIALLVVGIWPLCWAWWRIPKYLASKDGVSRKQVLPAPSSVSAAQEVEHPPDSSDEDNVNEQGEDKENRIEAAAEEDSPPRSKSFRREDYYRDQLTKLLGGLIAFGTLIVTVYKVIDAQHELLLKQDQANRISAYEHHQRALESLDKSAIDSVVLHVGAMYSLGSLGKEAPELQPAIANEIAAAARRYSAIAPKSEFAVPEDSTEVFPQTQAALVVIGQLDKMKSGLPLQLDRLNLRGISMPQAQLNGTDMQQTDFSGADLYNVYFYNANLRRANFDGANLSEVVLSHAGLNGATLCEAINKVVPELNTGESVPARLRAAIADEVHFDGAWLVGMRFDTEKPKDPDKKDKTTGLEGSHFPYANLQRASFRRAVITNADFRGANLTDTDFTGAYGIDTIKTNNDTIICRARGLQTAGKTENCLPANTLDLTTCPHDGRSWWEIVHNKKPPDLDPPRPP